MLPRMNVDELAVQVTNIDKGHVEPPVPPVGSLQTGMKIAEIAGEQAKNTEEISAFSNYFKYISDMSSFEDPYFKATIKKELLKDRKLTERAFRALSPVSVCGPFQLVDGHRLTPK